MTSSWQHRGNNSDQVFWYTFGCQNRGKKQGNLSLGVFFPSIILAVQTGTPVPDISITGLSSINLALPWQPNACFSSWNTAACVTAWLNSNKRGQSSQKKLEGLNFMINTELLAKDDPKCKHTEWRKSLWFALLWDTNERELRKTRLLRGRLICYLLPICACERVSSCLWRLRPTQTIIRVLMIDEKGDSRASYTLIYELLFNFSVTQFPVALF